MNKTKATTFSPTVFFYNGIISAFSSLALRFVGMTFNVFLSSHAGAQAMGLLSLVYSVWGFVLTAGCAGAGLASARLCAESFSRKESVRAAGRKCLQYSFICASIIGGIFFLITPLFGRLLGDSRTVTPLRILAISLPFVSMSASLSGYFNARRATYKNSICQISEQIVRIAITTFIFSKMRYKDAGAYCSSIILGGALAEMVSFFILYTLYLLEGRKHENGRGCTVTLARIAKITVPVCISASIRSGLVSVEHILIPKGLTEFGYTNDEALSLFGTVHGMAIPIILFCISIPSAFSVLLIPKIAEQNTVGCIEEIRYVGSRAYRTALIFSFGVASYLTLSAFLLGNSLYPGTDAARYIYIFAPLIPIMYVDSVSDAVLKGMGEQLYSMKINIADAAISVLAVFLLVPKIGIVGYVIAIYLSEGFNTCASMLRVIQLTKSRMPVLRFVISPLLLSVAAANLTRIFYLYSRNIDASTSLTIGGILFTLTYVSLLLASGSITREERRYFIRLITKERTQKKGSSGKP